MHSISFALHNLIIYAVAALVFFAATARTWIVAAYLGFYADRLFGGCCFAAAGAGSRYLVWIGSLAHGKSSLGWARLGWARWRRSVCAAEPHIGGVAVHLVVALGSLAPFDIAGLGIDAQLEEIF
jgi:hypothetical protein